MKSCKLITLVMSLLMASAAVAQPALDSSKTTVEAPKNDEQELEKIQVLGSRMSYKSAGDTAVPVDIISEAEISMSGISETGKLLQSLSPSFNFSYTTISDGTDIVRPATLRGLGPDQVLVLVNGKRRHSQALVNIQQTIGRGSTGTDINSIPITAIESIQILRDGAAAQYGSDAIAGVVNIVLKSPKASSGEVNFYSGQNFFGDGLINQASLGHNLNLGKGGMRVSGDVRYRGQTNRADTDTRFGTRTMRIGEAQAEDFSLFINGDFPLGATGELYWFGGATRRNGESAGFFREPESERNLRSLYPEGFLPLLLTNVEDQSASVGYRLDIAEDWQMDNSLTAGRNSFNYNSKNSLNVSLGSGSPTSTDNGTLLYQELNYNSDFTGKIDIGLDNPLNVTIGGALRGETYEIQPGDFASYAYGPTNDPNQLILGPNGERASAGIQGFPGFQPADAGESQRSSQALYVDTESYLTGNWLVGLAARTENYEGAGSATIGKLSSRVDVTPGFAFRGALSSGFRAPSLQQANFSNRSTTFAQNKLTETVTAPQGSQPYRALNLPDLKNESSVSSTLGVVWKPGANSEMTLDLYNIDIKDRIAFSGMLEPELAANCNADNSNCPIRAILDPLNLGAVQFFTNGISTRTQGLDVVLAHSFYFKNYGRLKAFASGHLNQTQVTRVSPRGDISSAVIFDETQIVLTEQGQPRQRLVVGLDYLVGRWNFNGRLNYFGSVAGRGFGNYYQKFSGDWLTDVSTTYNFSKNFALVIGANNLFNVLPDELNPDHPVRGFAGGSFRYSWETAPFGYNGGFYYTRLAYSY